MAPKRKAGPIPTGWTLKTVVQKDGSQTSMYYCPATGQHFYTYFELMRYVKYAMKAGVSIYEPSCKSVKRIKSLEKDSPATNSRKTSSILSLRKKPSSESKSSIVEQSMDSQLSTSSESSDREKDEDYVPESESNVGGPDFK